MPPKTRSSTRTGRRAAREPGVNGNAAEERQPSPTTSHKGTQSGKHNQEAPEMCPDMGRVAGARLSSFKHSGLLEKDEKALKKLLEDEEELFQLPTQLVSQSSAVGEGGVPEGQDPDGVSGRDIYSIKSLGRSSQKAKRRHTDTNTDLSSTPTTSLQGKKRLTTTQQKLGGAGNITVSPEVDVRCDETVQDSAIKGNKKGSSVGNEMSSKGKGKARKVRWSSDSEQDDVSEISEEEDVDEEMASIAAQLNRGTTAENALEDYFTAHADKAGVTSDRTLSRLSRPRLEQEAVQSALQAVPSPFQTDYQQLYEDYTHLYPYWSLQMHSGFNILLFGLGSKKRLMEDYCKTCLSKSCHLVVNGYFPGLTIKQVLSTLSSDLLGHSGSFKSHSEHAQFITNTLEERCGKDAPCEIFLLIHNLDGSMLRNDSAQASLSILAASQHVHVLASVDHINAALLWDQTKLSRFNWLCHDVTTFEPYQEETSYENSLLVQHSGSLALSSLTHVLKSLTPNARGIFKLLAEYQLEHKKEAEKHYQGLAFGECYRRCREKFFVNSDLTLRAQLTEFRDHKLVRSAKGDDGVEYLSIPVDDATLSQFLSDFVD